MPKIEYRSDGGDFAEIVVDDELAVALNKDEHDLETAGTVAKSIADKLGIEYTEDYTYYDYDPDTNRLTKD